MRSRPSPLALAPRPGAAPPAAGAPPDPAHRWSFPRGPPGAPGLPERVVVLHRHARGEGDAGAPLRVPAHLLPRRPRPRGAAPRLRLGRGGRGDGPRRRDRRRGAGRTCSRRCSGARCPLLGGFPAGARPGPRLGARAGGDATAAGGRGSRAAAFRLAARDDARGIALDLALRPHEAARAAGAERPLAQVGRRGVREPLRLARRASRPRGTLRAGRAAASRCAARAGWTRRWARRSSRRTRSGWDWWSLRLARRPGPHAVRAARARTGPPRGGTGTLVERDGTRPAARARGVVGARDGDVASAASGAVYPSGWSVEVPRRAGLRLDGRRRRSAAAENRSAILPGLSYWEGPVRVAGPGGAPAGEGYVELTGYAKGARLPL